MVYEVHQTATFTKWLKSVKDRIAKARIISRLIAIETDGHFGDYKSVGVGVSELRVYVSKGYRVYYTFRGNRIVLLLAGSDKASQARTIALAKQLAKRQGKHND